MIFNYYYLTRFQMSLMIFNDNLRKEEAMGENADSTPSRLSN